MAMASDGPTGSLRFGRFTLIPLRRELLDDGKPVDVGGRAFDVLLALVESGGKVVSNEELMNRVWPGRVVEDNSLHAHVSALRRALGDQRSVIRTVSGRGYQFVADVQRGAVAAAAPPPVAVATNLPEWVSELIGRDPIVGEVRELLAHRRLVTLVGTGGIGKTRLALEVARGVVARHPDGVWLAELGPLTDADLVAATVARAVGVMPISGTVSSPAVAAAVRGRSLLLVLDNCEHLITPAAHLADDLLRASAGVTILATSREPLMTEGEYVYRVPPLEVLEETDPLDFGAFETGALRLFMARVRASDPGFVPDPAFARAAAAICRCLDGIPLAIELAATRCGALGIDELAARLDDRFRLLSAGRRTALPRHQTLQAAFDWSHDLLSEAERVVFRRLAVFVGSFSLPAARAVVPGGVVAVADVADLLAQLVDKSLVAADVSRGSAAYRLLETTRAYALQRLLDTDESMRHAGLHAAYYLAALEKAGVEMASWPPADWKSISARDLDNVRAALDWAHSEFGDAAIAELLTIAAVPLWMHLSLVNECRQRVLQALGGERFVGPRDERREMRLQAALGAALLYTSMGPDARAALSRALEIARHVGDPDYELRALWGLWVDRLNGGAFAGALAVGEQFLAVADGSTDPNDVAIGHRLVGIALHFLGEQARAAAHLERMLAGYVAPSNFSHIIRFQFDPRLTARCFEARVRWLRGFADEAMRIVGSTIQEAQSLHHELSLVNSLGQGACLLALFTGDLDAADAYTAMLEEHATRHGIALWQAWGRCFAGAVQVRRGDLEGGLERLRSAFVRHPETRLLPRYMVLLGELAVALAAHGELDEAKATVEEALSRAEGHGERWYLAELLRIRGIIAQAEGRPSEAEQHLLEAIDCARRQEVLALELRAATSLARLRGGDDATGRALLVASYRRFTEGFETADLEAARQVLGADAPVT
jgi:predicted ATPase/DNA-binding winged helix-turn-helix (wHTH) protein